ncbi:Uncharacterised protein [Mycobacteroides abscessus subsp. abscessus]|nr:Uncharacterised protein [Mycobacteroides abscessus subsp. abscessus]
MLLAVAEHRAGQQIPRENADTDDGVVQPVVGGHQPVVGQPDHGVHLEGKSRDGPHGQQRRREQQRGDRGELPCRRRCGQQRQRYERRSDDQHPEYQTATGTKACGKPAGQAHLTRDGHQPRHHEDACHQRCFGFLVVGEQRRLQRKCEVHLERQHIRTDHGSREQQEGLVGHHRTPAGQHRSTVGVALRLCPVRRQRHQLNHRQECENRRGDSAGDPEVPGRQRQADDRSEKDARLVEDVEHREGLYPALTRVGGQVGTHRRVEESTGETRCRRGDQYRRKSTDERQHQKSGGPQEASGDNQRLVPEPVGQRATNQKHALLREVADPEHQSHHPRGQAQGPGQISGEIRHQHVEADIDGELVHHQYLAGPIERPELAQGLASSGCSQVRIGHAVRPSGSITWVSLVHRSTTRCDGSSITSGSCAGGRSSRSWLRQ